jgi:hypothetical protein
VPFGILLNISRPFSPRNRTTFFFRDANSEIVPINVQSNFQIGWMKMRLGRVVEIRNLWSCKDNVTSSQGAALPSFQKISQVDCFGELDPAGYAGLEDEVGNHWGALFKAALLSTLLGVGSELGSTSGTGNNSDIIQALRRGSSDSFNQTGQQTVRRNLNIQPTLTIRPGFPVRVIVNRDLVLEPYKG